jgi:hypothetical protein
LKIEVKITDDYHLLVTRLTIIKLNQFLTLFVSQRYQEFKDRREKEEARARGEAVYDGELSQAEKVRIVSSLCHLSFIHELNSPFHNCLSATSVNVISTE